MALLFLFLDLNSCPLLNQNEKFIFSPFFFQENQQHGFIEVFPDDNFKTFYFGFNVYPEKNTQETESALFKLWSGVFLTISKLF